MADERPPEPLTFEAARERLRERGYLDRGVEGAVLKGALAARTRAKSLLLGAAIGALFLAVAVALAETALNTAASSLPLRDALVLFLWLALGSLVVAAVVVALLVAAAALRLRGRGDAEGMSAEIAAAFGALAGVGAVLAALPALRASGPLAALGVLLVVAVAVFIAVRAARGVAIAVVVASGRAVLSSKRRLGLVGLAAFLLTLAGGAAAWALRGGPGDAGLLVVEANARRVVLVGVDGWSDRYLPEVPAGYAATFGVGGARFAKGERDVAAFWTTVATGEPASRHGIGSLDLVRVAGVSAAFRPVGASAFYLRDVLPLISVARRESVTAAARRVPAMWEVARRAGVASLVVNWWTTYPAGDGGGTILSNHLYFAARAGAPLAGEGWPPETTQHAAAAAQRRAPPSGTLERLVADATGADDFAMRAFADVFERERPRLALLYLPGLDILGAALSDPGRTAADRVALAGAVTSEAAKIRSFLDAPALRERADLLAVLFDGGRTEGGGDLRLAGPLARPGTSGTIRPSDVAPTLLAVLGIPASRELSGTVEAALLVPGAVTPATVASWGLRPRDATVVLDPKEYVENLKSLGYLK